MAVTVAQLAGAIRAGDGLAAPPEPVAGILTRLLAVAVATIERAAPEAPEVVRDEAAIRFCGYVYDQPNTTGGDRYAAALRNSGALSIIGPWRVHRGGLAESEAS